MEWNKKEQREEIADPGVKDKRLLVIEPEFAGVLAVAERHGNQLTSILRHAWDGRKLSTITKNSPLTATGAHISLIGHITISELLARLTRTDIANGFANRFGFALIRRSKLLPHGGHLPDDEIIRLGKRTLEALTAARNIGRVFMTDEAAREWTKVYSGLSVDANGLLGSVTARGEAQCVRLALIYALLDGSPVIDVPHLMAASAVWEYCEASAAHIFGGLIGDPVADEVLRALQQAGDRGMTRNAIRDMFGRHKSSDRIGAALALLMTNGKARAEVKATGGRPADVWFATREDN